MTPATTAEAPDGTRSPGFADGFGLRQRSGEQGRRSTSRCCGCAKSWRERQASISALRERVSRLANFRHAYYAKVRRVDRLDSGAGARAGRRHGRPARGCRRILEVAHASGSISTSTRPCAWCGKSCPAVAMLHQNARDVSHGALAPERILVTPNARWCWRSTSSAAPSTRGLQPRTALEATADRGPAWRGAAPAEPSRRRHAGRRRRAGAGPRAARSVEDLRDLPALLASATENSVMGGRGHPLRRAQAMALASNATRLARVVRVRPRGAAGVG